MQTGLQTAKTRNDVKTPKKHNKDPCKPTNLDTKQRNLTAHSQSPISSLSRKTKLEGFPQGCHCGEVSVTTPLLLQHRDTQPTKPVDFPRFATEIIPEGSPSLLPLNSFLWRDFRTTLYHRHGKLTNSSLSQLTATRRQNVTEFFRQTHLTKQAITTVTLTKAISLTKNHLIFPPLIEHLDIIR